MASGYAKLCKTCNQELPVENFHRLKASKDGFQYSCKSCMNELRRIRYATKPEARDKARKAASEWRKKQWRENPHYREEATAYMRKKMLRRDYNMTVEQYEELLAAQGGVCAICGEANKDGRNLAVDHDHSCCPGKKSCGKCIRGLLCSTCNLTLGKYNDNAKVFHEMHVYLETYNDVKAMVI